MDTKSTNAAVVEREGGTGALTVLLHPLVLIHISDHYTRLKFQTGQENPRVIGALLGTQTGRTVEVATAWELLWKAQEGNVQIDQQFLLTKSEQCKLVFKIGD